MTPIPALAAWAAMLTLVTSVATADALPVPPFAATYTVYARGLPLGEGQIVLEDAGGGHYRMRSEVRPTGLAALVVGDRVSESAEGHYREGVVYPVQYRHLRNGGNETVEIHADFDWQQYQVAARENEEQVLLPLRDGVVDPLSLHLLAMSDLSNRRTPDRYSFVDDLAIKTYSVRQQGEETLQTPIGQLRTLKISQNRPDSTRITTLWFAVDLHYLPVQIRQEKKGRETLRMTIEHFNQATAAAF